MQVEVKQKEDGVRDIVEELGQRVHGIVPQVGELLNQHLRCPVGDGRSRERRRFVGQKVPVVGRTELCSEVWVVYKSEKRVGKWDI
jgi:hypothetical protein